MIIIDLHVFIPWKKRLYIWFYQTILYTHIHHQIFVVPWLICQDQTCIFYFIYKYYIHKFFIHSLSCPDSSVRFQSKKIKSYPDLSIRIQCKYYSRRILNCPSGSNANVFWVVSWLVFQDPTQILFCVLIWYYLSKHRLPDGIGTIIPENQCIKGTSTIFPIRKKSHTDAKSPTPIVFWHPSTKRRNPLIPHNSRGRQTRLTRQ